MLVVVAAVVGICIGAGAYFILCSMPERAAGTEPRREAKPERTGVTGVSSAWRDGERGAAPP